MAPPSDAKVASVETDNSSPDRARHCLQPYEQCGGIKPDGTLDDTVGAASFWKLLVSHVTAVVAVRCQSMS